MPPQAEHRQDVAAYLRLLCCFFGGWRPERRRRTAEKGSEHGDGDEAILCNFTHQKNRKNRKKLFTFLKTAEGGMCGRDGR